jgi:hypothetical protein
MPDTPPPLQKRVDKPPLWLLAAAIWGIVMAAMYLGVSLLLIIDVSRPLVSIAKAGRFGLAYHLVAAG